MTEMMSAKEKAWALISIRNARDTWAINPFLDIDKRQIMSPTHHVKYRKIKRKKRKKEEEKLHFA